MINFLRLSLWREAARGIGAFFCNAIYSLISFIYQLFITVSRLNILSEDTVAPIYQRVTMILTIIMAFYITFEFVKYAIQPDIMSDKEKGVGNLALKFVAVILLIAFVPRIFTLAYKLQNTVIENQVFSKVILGKKNLDFGTLGGEFSANVLSQFYYLNTEEDACANMGGNCETAELAINNNLANLELGNAADISYGINLTAQSSGSTVTFDDAYKPAIKFDGIMAIIVGGLIVYILALYCIDVGTRYAQLIFLQIMAPIAIIGYLSPKKDGIFGKWCKQCITTYLDLFIRIAIIYFILLIISLLGDAFDSGNLFAGIDGGNVTTPIKAFSYIVLVLGLLVFAQRAPKLLSELLPSSGAAGIGFGLGAKSRFDNISKSIKGIGSAFNAASRTTGAVGGFVAGGIAGRSLRGALEGAKKGAAKDTKGGRLKNAAYAGRGVLERRRDIRNNGGTTWGSEHRAGYYKNEAQEQDRRVANLEAMKNKKKAVDTAVGNLKYRKQMESMTAAIEQSSPEAAREWAAAKKDVEKITRKFAAGEIKDVEEFKKQIQQRITKFNNSTNLNVSAFDDSAFELDSSKWGNVKTSIDEAKKVAQAIQKEKYKDRDGNEHEIGYDEETFAGDLGSYADNAETASEQLKAKDEYKRAHENAKGADGKK